MRANFVLSGVAAGIRRNATMTIALILNTAIALSFVGAAILANTEITRFRTTYEDKLNVQVYLCTDLAYNTQIADRATAIADKALPRKITCAKDQQTTAAQTAAVQALLRKDPHVASFYYINEKRALELGKKQLPDSAQFLKIGTFPASFSVKLKDIKNDYNDFAATYDTVPGIDKVNNQINTINALLNLIDSRAVVLDRHRAGRADRVRVADREHDPGGGEPAAQRDEHHAVGRRVPLDDRVAVHARGGHRGRRRGADRRSDSSRSASMCCSTRSSARRRPRA